MLAIIVVIVTGVFISNNSTESWAHRLCSISAGWLTGDPFQVNQLHSNQWVSSSSMGSAVIHTAADPTSMLADPGIRILGGNRHWNGICSRPIKLPDGLLWASAWLSESNCSYRLLLSTITERGIDRSSGLEAEVVLGGEGVQAGLHWQKQINYVSRTAWQKGHKSWWWSMVWGWTTWGRQWGSQGGGRTQVL